MGVQLEAWVASVLPCLKLHHSLLALITCLDAYIARYDGVSKRARNDKYQGSEVVFALGLIIVIFVDGPLTTRAGTLP